MKNTLAFLALSLLVLPLINTYGKSNNTVDIRCPPTKSITFHPRPTHQQWNRYYATGYTQTLRGNAPSFLMDSDTDNTHVIRLNGASYYSPTHSFICVYYGGPQNELVLSEHAVQPILKNCKFITGPYAGTDECDGDVNNCVLECTR